MRADMVRRLEAIPGRHVVFVQIHREYYSTTEWVYNEAEIDRARIVWVHDMGPAMNEEVLRYYFDRKAWFVNVEDAQEFRLAAQLRRRALIDVRAEDDASRVSSPCRSTRRCAWFGLKRHLSGGGSLCFCQRRTS